MALSIAYAPEPVDELPDPVEDWLVEQLEALADELWTRCYRSKPRLPWNPDDCPWHRRMRESGMTEVECPICSQINRSRRRSG